MAPRWEYRIIQRDMGFAGLEFVWQDTREQDPREAAQIDVAYVNAGIITANEVRERMGLGAVASGQRNPLPFGEGRVRAEKFNPHHDECGRFTDAQNAVAPNYQDLPGITPRSSASASGVETAAALPLAIPATDAAIAIGAAIVGSAAAQGQLKPVPLNMDEDDGQSGGNENADNGADNESNKKPEEPKDDKETEWKLGSYKSKERWDNQMKARNWTEQEITDTIRDGKKYLVENNVNKGNPANIYIKDSTGRYIVKDEITKEIIQISGDEFQPPKPIISKLKQ